ncbi:hypothetical protein EON62_01030 [archaeon]|nr:MAG: hypothetical protein EON62_01030 [archaeon]
MRAIVAAVMFNVTVVAAPAPAPTLTAPADTPSRAASSAASTCNQHDVEGWLFAMLEALDGSATAHATTASQPRVVLTPGRRLLSSLLPSPDADGQFPRLAAAETPLSAASRESTSVSASPAHASVRAALLVPWTASLLVRLTIDAVHSPLATVAVEQAVQTNASTVMAAMRALVFKIKPQPQAQLAASGAADTPVVPSPPPSLTDDAAPEQPAVQLSLANVVLSLHTVVDALLTMRSQEPSAASPSGTVGTISAASPALLPLYLPPLVSLCDVLMFEAKI